jgi:ABC-type transport system involved in multi-copper enzyme maturation permease subunit
MSSYLQPALYGILLCLVQGVLALPWLAALDFTAFKQRLREPASWMMALAVVVGAGVLLGLGLAVVQDRDSLILWGRPFGAILQAQLILDFYVLVFAVLLLVWPKAGAVALAAFREGIRQPMFWLLVGIGLFCWILLPYIPYFTFGEDYKMVKELGYDLTMLLPVVFVVLNAATSISDEIEGRTAITLMSKPVSRRQFLLGKYVGILMAALVITCLLGWTFNIVLWYKPYYDGEPLPPAAWREPFREAYAGLGDITVSFVVGIREWFDVALAALPGQVLGFGQVMVLGAIAVALATRLPMVVNIVVCLMVFFLGHLSQVLVQVSEQRFQLVNFLARFFDALLPGMEFFNLGVLIARDMPPPPTQFAMYVGSVMLYATLYSAIALLFGLILFEDRDLA